MIVEMEEDEKSASLWTELKSCNYEQRAVKCWVSRGEKSKLENFTENDAFEAKNILGDGTKSTKTTLPGPGSQRGLGEGGSLVGTTIPPGPSPLRQPGSSRVVRGKTDTDSVVDVSLVETSSVEPKGKKVDAGDTSYEAVYSSQEDIKNFNSWYIDNLNKKKTSLKSKPKDKSKVAASLHHGSCIDILHPHQSLEQFGPQLSSIPEPTIPSGPQAPNPSSCKVDVVNKPCIATCPAIIPNMASLQGMVVIIVLTLLNLLMKSKPQFHNVPAAFSMPTTSYPYPTSQPSSLSPRSQFLCEPSQPSCYCGVASTARTMSKARVDMLSSVTLCWKWVRMSAGKAFLSMARAAAGDDL